jgi:hypothetical protein
MGPTGCLGGPGPVGAGAAYRGTQGHTKVADQDRPSRLVGNKEGFIEEEVPASEEAKGIIYLIAC